MTMADQASQVRISERDDIAFVTVHGNIDSELAPGLRDVLTWAISQHDAVVVDLSAATSVDRAGLGVLLQAQDQAHQRASRLCLAEPSPALMATLAALRADAMFPMTDLPAAMTQARNS